MNLEIRYFHCKKTGEKSTVFGQEREEVIDYGGIIISYMAFEKQDGMESVDQKMKKLSTPDLSEDQKRSFKDLSSELGKPKDGGENYTGKDIQDAASKRINSMVESSGKKLSPQENEKLDTIKGELLKDMGNKNPKDAIEEYGKLRDKIAGIIAAGEGKGKVNNDNLEKSQKQQIDSQKANTDSFEKLQKFIEGILSDSKEQQKKSRMQQESAKIDGDKSQGVMNPELARDASSELSEKWP